MRFFLILFFLSVFYNSNCQTDCDTFPYCLDLKYANQIYKNDSEKAKKYYLKAAKLGSSEAHFYLAYRYSVSQEDGIYHFSEAAKKGHEKALAYALDYLFFRGNSFTHVNPKKALEIYYLAKKANPNLTLYDEKNKLNTLKIAASFDLLDYEEIIKKYDLPKNSSQYYIWELAELASKGEVFDNPSSDLVMKLIIKGGFVPAEIMYAVQDYYSQMELSDELIPFKICNYITSGFGQGYCSSKSYDKWKIELEKEIHNFSLSIDTNYTSILYRAYDAAIEFIHDKAFHEEGHDGSGHVAWAYESVIEQQRKYIDFLKKINNGFIPKNVGSFELNDAALNLEYNLLLNQLKSSPIQGMRFTVSDERLRHVQRLWLPYRNLNTELFIILSNQKNKTFWYNFFTVERLKDFKSIKQLSDDYSY